MAGPQRLDGARSQRPQRQTQWPQRPHWPHRPQWSQRPQWAHSHWHGRHHWRHNLAKMVASWQALVANTHPLVPCSYPWVALPHPMAATSQMDKAMETMVFWPAAVQAPAWAWSLEAHPPLAKLWPRIRGRRCLERLVPWFLYRLPWLRPGKIQDLLWMILWLFPQDYQDLSLFGKLKWYIIALRFIFQT